jgi:glutaredoxin-related protein
MSMISFEKDNHSSHTGQNCSQNRHPGIKENEQLADDYSVVEIWKSFRNTTAFHVVRDSSVV